MAPRTVVSYDATVNDLDALAFGRVLADAGAELILAYVRHASHPERTREEIEAAHADALLERGAEWLGEPLIERRVVVSPSTAQGLCELAALEGADILVFGSDYRTATGHIALQRSAECLLECGSTAIALAPAGYHAQPKPRIVSIGVLAAPGDDTTLATARDLAESFEARLTRDERHVDLLVVGSRPEAAHGRLMITAQAQNEIANATCPVLVLPHGVTLRFPQLATL